MHDTCTRWSRSTTAGGARRSSSRTWTRRSASPSGTIRRCASTPTRSSATSTPRATCARSARITNPSPTSRPITPGSAITGGTDLPRLVTVNDLYSFDPNAKVSIEPFIDIIGRHFKQPKEGLGYDNSAGGPHVAHDHVPGPAALMPSMRRGLATAAGLSLALVGHDRRRAARAADAVRLSSLPERHRARRASTPTGLAPCQLSR